MGHRLVGCQRLDAQAAMLVGEPIAARAARDQQVIAVLEGSFALGPQRVLELAIEKPAFPARIECHPENSVERARAGREVMLVNAGDGMFQRIVRSAWRQERVEDFCLFHFVLESIRSPGN